jgi:hypothetical protein
MSPPDSSGGSLELSFWFLYLIGPDSLSARPSAKSKDSLRQLWKDSKYIY